MIQCLDKQIPLFGPNVQVLKYFGILPNYHFKTNRLKGTRWTLLQLFLFLTFISALEVFIWAEKFYNEYSEDYLPIAVRVMCEVSGLVMFISVVIWSYTNRKHWEKLFQQITFVHNQQIVKETNERKKTFLRNANLYFIIITFCILVLYCMDILFWQLENNSVTFVLSYVYFYYSFLLSNLIGYIALEIQNQYKFMRNALAASEYTNPEEFIKIVRQIKWLYAEMHKVIETFNKLFGKMLLLLAIQCSLQVLDFGVFLVEKVLPQLKFQYDTLIIYVVFIILNLTWFSVTQVRCDTAKYESLNLLSVSYNLLENQCSSTELHNELKSLINRIKYKPVLFTADHFFEIKKSTTFSIVGTTATYFIVYVELRNSDTSWGKKNMTL